MRQESCVGMQRIPSITITPTRNAREKRPCRHFATLNTVGSDSKPRDKRSRNSSGGDEYAQISPAHGILPVFRGALTSPHARYRSPEARWLVLCSSHLQPSGLWTTDEPWIMIRESVSRAASRAELRTLVWIPDIKKDRRVPMPLNADVPSRANLRGVIVTRELHLFHRVKGGQAEARDS